MDFFFILSGFIIFRAHCNDIGHPSAFRPYAVKRLIRIFVPYLPIGLLYAVLYTSFPSLPGAAPDRWNWASSVLLFPDDRAPALNPGWTLEHELLFYILFSALILFRRAGLLTLGVWGVALIWNLVGAVPVKIGRLFDPINLEFLFGLGVFLTVRQDRIWLRAAIAALAIVVGVVALIQADAMQPNLLPLHEVIAWIERYRLCFGCLLASIMIGLLAVRLPWKTPRLLVWVGDASYSIYLIHVPTQAVVCRVLAHMGGQWKPYVFVILVVSSIVMGVAYHLWFEKPVLAWVRGCGWLVRVKAAQ